MESYRKAVNRARREYLTRVMAECGFVVATAALAAGCHRSDFYKLLDKYAPGLPRRSAAPGVRATLNAHGEPVARSGNAAWKALDAPEARA